MSFELLRNIVFFSVSIVIIYIDIKRLIIPDYLSLPLIGLGIFFSFYTHEPGWKSSLMGMLVGFAIFYIIAWSYTKATRQIGLGGGDVKYLAGIGAFLGINGVAYVMLISSILALIAYLILRIVKGKSFHRVLPYGPFLAIAAFGYIVFSL